MLVPRSLPGPREGCSESDRIEGMPRLSDARRASIRSSLAEGRSQAWVARREGVAESTVSRIARDVDRSVVPGVPDRTVVEPLHLAGMTVGEIAATLGVDKGLVRRSLRRYRLPLVSDGWLRQRYLKAGLTIAKMAAEAGCHPSMTLRYMIRAGIPRRRTGYRSTIDAAAVRAAIAAGETQTEVARRAGISPPTVSRIVRRSQT